MTCKRALTPRYSCSLIRLG